MNRRKILLILAAIASVPLFLIAAGVGYLVFFEWASREHFSREIVLHKGATLQLNEVFYTDPRDDMCTSSIEVQLRWPDGRVESVSGTPSSSSSADCYAGSQIKKISAELGARNGRHYLRVGDDIWARDSKSRVWMAWGVPDGTGEVEHFSRASTPAKFLQKMPTVAQEVDMTLASYAFERWNLSRNYVVFRRSSRSSSPKYLLFRATNEMFPGWKLDEPASLALSKRKIRPFLSNVRAEIVWMQLPLNWQEKSSSNPF
ncbi:MAG TPA: hypothetical protein VGB45_12225, partial [Abditibacterium sp.]